MAPGYLIEATLYTGQHLQSETRPWPDSEVARFELAEGVYVSGVKELRGMTMVESVAILAVHTGEVLCQLPSFCAIASPCPVA